MIDDIEKPQIDLNKLKASLESVGQAKRAQTIANAPFEQTAEAALLFLGMISFFIVDEAERLVKLAAVSRTEQYELAVTSFNFEPDNYELSLDEDESNDIVRAVTKGRPIDTTDWKSLAHHASDPAQSRLNQASAGIAYSVAYPVGRPCRAVLLFCYFQYKEKLGQPQTDFMRDYSRLVADYI